MHTHREKSTTGTDGTTVLCHTAYVWYGFIPVPVMPEVSAGGGTVSKNGTHGIPVKYPNGAPGRVHQGFPWGIFHLPTPLPTKTHAHAQGCGFSGVRVVGFPTGF